jgi:hypothetical protein
MPKEGEIDKNAPQIIVLMLRIGHSWHSSREECQLFRWWNTLIN